MQDATERFGIMSTSHFNTNEGWKLSKIVKKFGTDHAHLFCFIMCRGIDLVDIFIVVSHQSSVHVTIRVTWVCSTL